MTYFRVSQQGSLANGDNWVSNFHVLSSSTLLAVHTQADSLIDTFWNNTFKTYIDPATTLDAVVTTELNSTNGKNVSAQETGHAIVGTGTAPSTPGQCCILISYRTGSAAKGGRGRQYLPGPVVGDTLGDGSLSPTVANAIDTGWTQVVSGMVSVGQVVVLHGGYKKNPDGTVTHVPLSHDAVTNVGVAETLATQRRRVNRAAHNYTPFLAV